MKKICITALALLIIPSVSFAEIAIQDGYSIEGKIFAVKTSKKYASVDSCAKIAMSKSRVAGFTFKSSSKKCFLYKNVRALKEDSGSVSGTK
jgi:hypothetical protein|tara:strand:+ start:612 stop:887 length:276 start_codon:yes stop_codon:yes gene_type:complete